MRKIEFSFEAEMRRMSYVMSCTKHALGAAGEIYACSVLNHNGYRTVIDHQKYNGDLQIECPSGLVLRAEVKTAQQNKEGRYSFTLSVKRGGLVETLCTQVDLVILLAVRPSGVVRIYSIPRAALGERQLTVKIGKKDSGLSSKYEQYRQHERKFYIDERSHAQRLWEQYF